MTAILFFLDSSSFDSLSRSTVSFGMVCAVGGVWISIVPSRIVVSGNRGGGIPASSTYWRLLSFVSDRVGTVILVYR